MTRMTTNLVLYLVVGQDEVTIAPPMEAVKRKLRRAGDPVRATEGEGSSTLVAYNENRIRLQMLHTFGGRIHRACSTLRAE